MTKFRNEKPSMFLAVGDMIQGDNWANLFEGKSVIELMNAMEFDAALIDLNKENLREKETNRLQALMLRETQLHGL